MLVLYILTIITSGKRSTESDGFEILVILRYYEASKTLPSSEWAMVHSRSGYGFQGTSMRVYPWVTIEHVSKACSCSNMSCAFHAHVMRMACACRAQMMRTGAICARHEAAGIHTKLKKFTTPVIIGHSILSPDFEG